VQYNLIKKFLLNRQRKIVTIAIIAFLILTAATTYILLHQGKTGHPLSVLTTTDEVDSLESQHTEQVSDIEKASLNILITPTYNPNNPSADKSVENNSLTVKPIDVADDEHLEFYDEFDNYNTSWNYFKGFVLSEVGIDGELYYQLLNKDKDIKIIVDKTQKNAVIYHDGKSMNYYMDFMITGTSTYAQLELCDITGDGEEELIISHSYGGTVFLDTTCDVIDLSAMTKYEMKSYLNELSSKIIVEPIEIS